MRNLKLVESARVGDVAGLVDVQCTCIDYDTKALYCATATGIIEFDPSNRQASSDQSGGSSSSELEMSLLFLLLISR